MRITPLLLCLIAATTLSAADRTPKAIENGQVVRAPIVEAEAIAEITPESVPSYEMSLDGIRFTVFRIRRSGAEAVRVEFEDIRLAPDQALLVYGTDSNDVWVYGGGPDNAAIVTGDTATIEIQCASECPSDLPFRIVDVEAVSLPEAVDQTAVVSDEVRTGNFRGLDVDYIVRDGMAVYEGDIVLGPADEIEPAYGSRKGSKDAVAITGQSYRWPKGRIPYVIASTVPTPSRILSAISHWNTKLAGTISLVPRTTESVYVQFIRSSSCSSNVGMFRSSNYVFVSDSCSTGSIIHEIGHTVGLWHEQSREDRNKHVKIIWSNIASSALSNFSQQITYGTDIGAYDFNSIMHYPAYAYSANGKPTIQTIPAGIPIGQRTALSTGDIAAVRSMYATTSTTSVITSPTPTPTAPAPISVTISANPATETIVVDGRSYTGSVTVQWVVGSNHTIGAANRSAGGTSSTFIRWNDGGAQSHSVAASSSTTLYKADFALAHRVTAGVNLAEAGTVLIRPASTDDYYAANSSLTLDALAASGYCFTSWTGLIGGTQSRATLAVTKPYTITANFQRGAFTLSETIKYPSSSGGLYSVGITGTGGCTWTAITSASWITLRVPSNGTGSGVLSYQVAPNTTPSARVGVIAVAGRNYFVSQAGSY